MQFPNPIVRSLILYDNNGNAVIVLGPGPFIKIINPTSGAEMDLDAGTTFPEIVFWNSGHTQFGKISLEENGVGYQSIKITSPPTASILLPGAPVIQPALSMDNTIVLSNRFYPSGLATGGYLYLDEAQWSVQLVSNTGSGLNTIFSYTGDASPFHANDIHFEADGSGGGWAFPPRLGFFTNYFISDDWQSFIFQNGWGNVGGNWTAGAYRANPDGRVWLKGNILGGTKTDGTVITTIGGAWRPNKDIVLPVAPTSGGSLVTTNIRIFAATGQVQIFGVAGSATGNISLDGSSYPFNAV